MFYSCKTLAVYTCRFKAAVKRPLTFILFKFASLPFAVNLTICFEAVFAFLYSFIAYLIWFTALVEVFTEIAKKATLFKAFPG